MAITETRYKIQTLEKLIDSGMDGGLIDKTLGKLIQYKTDKMERELQELKDSMVKFESRYNLDSETFYKKFGEGDWVMKWIFLSDTLFAICTSGSWRG